MVNEVFSKRLKSARLMRGLSIANLCELMQNAVSKQSISIHIHTLYYIKN